MIDPYDPPHPDGPVDPEDSPEAADTRWDEPEPSRVDGRLKFSLVREDPA